MKLKFFAAFFFIIIMSVFNSCKDDFDTGGAGPYTISGHLYLDCSMQPMVNQPIELFQEYATNLTIQGGVLASTTTDSLGYFKFEFRDLNGQDEKIRIPYGSGYRDLFEQIPNHKSYSNLVVFRNYTTNIYVSLIVHNPWTSNDTLEITDYRNLNQKLKLPGPFASGLLYSIQNYPTLITSLTPIQTTYGYRINNGPWTLKSLPMPSCDSTNIVAEIY